MWISAAIPKTNPKEIAAILSEPPAIFSIVARRDQVSALCARMNDIGIYAMEIQPALNHASGFDEKLAQDSVFLLKNLRDAEVKNLLSICNMEYYALSQGFRAEQSQYGDILEHARDNLFQLLESIFNICQRYQTLEKREHPKVIQQRVLELKARPDA